MLVPKLEELMDELKTKARDAAVGKHDARLDGDKSMESWYDGKLDGLVEAMTMIAIMKNTWITEGV